MLASEVFKVGDLVSPRMTYSDPHNDGDKVRSDVVYIIRKVAQFAYLEGSSIEFHPINLNKVGEKDTKLNRKLYPTYIKYRGFLIAPEIADQLNEITVDKQNKTE